jgi:hypothetical protein
MTGRSKLLANLAQANDVRLRRAEDKRRIGRRELDPATVLREVPAHWSSAEIMELLISMPWVGRVKARKWCRLALVSPNRPIEAMTPRERAAVTRAIGTWTGRCATRNAQPDSCYDRPALDPTSALEGRRPTQEGTRT